MLGVISAILHPNCAYNTLLFLFYKGENNKFLPAQRLLLNKLLDLKISIFVKSYWGLWSADPLICHAKFRNNPRRPSALVSYWFIDITDVFNVIEQSKTCTLKFMHSIWEAAFQVNSCKIRKIIFTHTAGWRMTSLFKLLPVITWSLYTVKMIENNKANLCSAKASRIQININSIIFKAADEFWLI